MSPIQWNLFTAAAVCVLQLCARVHVAAQFNTPPPCVEEDVMWCINSATQSSTASGCNWFRLVPPMQTCVDEATMGCTYDYQEQWKARVADFNTSLQTDECYPACKSQERRAAMMFECFSSADYESLIGQIQASNDGPQDINCMVLNEMSRCLRNATAGCPALTDVSHERITAVSAAGDAFKKCSVPVFEAATTSAPLDLDNTRPLVAGAGNMSAVAAQTKTDVGQLILIIIGSIVIAATVIVIIIVIIVTIRRRRAAYRKSIFKDWRPNGQRVYMDEPQFVSTQAVAAPAGFRPLKYTNNSGFLNEAIVVD